MNTSQAIEYKLRIRKEAEALALSTYDNSMRRIDEMFPMSEDKPKNPHVYIVIENGEAYPIAYTTYDAAVSDVKIKYKEIIEEELKQCDGDPKYMASDIYVEENMSGKTRLYIEKGISIIIYKLPIMPTA
jgi:hypothetical protein